MREEELLLGFGEAEADDNGCGESAMTPGTGEVPLCIFGLLIPVYFCVDLLQVHKKGINISTWL